MPNGTLQIIAIFYVPKQAIGYFGVYNNVATLNDST